MTLKDEFQQLALELITSPDAFGSMAKTAVHSRVSTGFLTGSSFQQTTTTQSIKGSIQQFKKSRDSTETIQVGDIKFLVAYLSMSMRPDVDDTLTIDAKTYRVIAVMDTAEALYTLHLRAS